MVVQLVVQLLHIYVSNLEYRVGMPRTDMDGIEWALDARLRIPDIEIFVLQIIEGSTKMYLYSSCWNFSHLFYG